ncbi:hypothetical protein BH23THE1_BH23THE1_34260 [soil metagenome]
MCFVGVNIEQEKETTILLAEIEIEVKIKYIDKDGRENEAQGPVAKLLVKVKVPPP